ncbi:MAG: AraC family transcriptional regulator [Bacteroidetes bacterium]|nr:MAG: AraC family transcriptional regulator [Bacteroidota bacterium]
MPVKKLLEKIELADPQEVDTLVENRRVFTLENCELNIYETQQQSFSIPLTFRDLVITSMICGKKIMHLPDQPAFDYLPGETVILPANQKMVIDFPEAEPGNPTQCIALTVEAGYIRDTVYYLNQYYNSATDERNNWDLRFNQYHFSNDNEISDLINKIIRICSSSNGAKDIFADLNLKELLIRLIQSQYLVQVTLEREGNTNQSRMHYLLNYIHEHLSERISVNTLSRKAYLSRNLFFKWFKEQCGLSPLEYIIRERIKLAKKLLGDPKNDIRTVSFLSGFNDINYFTRAFRKIEGITPGTYQSLLTGQFGK